MTDIVERLRDIDHRWATPADRMKAADEIDRLRKQLVSDINAEDEIARLEAEIEKLHVLVMDGVFDKARARDEALEEAAKVAADPRFRQFAIADAIRALKETNDRR